MMVFAMMRTTMPVAFLMETIAAQKGEEDGTNIALNANAKIMLQTTVQTVVGLVTGSVMMRTTRLNAIMMEVTVA